MDYKDLKKDTEDLYKKQCEVKYGLIELDIMFPQYKIPYNNDRLKDSVYLLMYRLLLRLILDGVKKICWSKCNDDTDKTLKPGITKDMIPFEELWVNGVRGNEWQFFSPPNIRRERVKNKYEKYPPGYGNTQKYSGEFLPQDKKIKAICNFNSSKDYFIQEMKYNSKYFSSWEIREDKKSHTEYMNEIKKCIKKIEKAPINKTDLARKRLELSKLDIVCDDILEIIVNHLDRL